MQFTLVPWREEFIDDIAHFADNPRIAQNLRDVFPYPYTRADAEGYIRECIAHGDEGQLCRAIVIDGRAAGSVGLFRQTDVARCSAELGYWLAEDYWGRGVMTQAVRQITAAGFAQLGVVRVFATPFATNRGSQRVLEKAGFRLEGVLEKSVYKNGRLLDSCLYARIAPGAQEMPERGRG